VTNEVDVQRPPDGSRYQRLQKIMSGLHVRAGRQKPQAIEYAMAVAVHRKDVSIERVE
jgi:hypothetical protein